MEDELEKELALNLEKVTSEVRAPLRAVPAKDVTLTDQWTKLKAIDQQLRKRIRQERLMLTAEFDRLVVATNNDFDMRVEDAVTAIEAERHNALRILREKTAEKLREHDLLARQMDL